MAAADAPRHEAVVAGKKAPADTNKAGHLNSEQIAALIAKAVKKATAPKKPRGPGQPVEVLRPTQWKPGQSGNPSGGPKKDIAAEIAQAIFQLNKDAIYQVMAERLLATGDQTSFDALSNRAFGKLTDKQENTQLGPDGLPINPNVSPIININFVDKAPEIAPQAPTPTPDAPVAVPPVKECQP